MSINKLGKVPSKSLKALLSDFYSANQIADAKDILFNVIDDLKLLNVPKVSRRRRDSTSKQGADLDDIFTLLTYLDEYKELVNITNKGIFVCNNPEAMPCTKLTEGAIDMLLNKVRNIEDIFIAKMESLTNMVEKLSKTVDVLAVENVRQPYQPLLGQSSTSRIFDQMSSPAAVPAGVQQGARSTLQFAPRITDSDTDGVWSVSSRRKKKKRSASSSPQ